MVRLIILLAKKKNGNPHPVGPRPPPFRFGTSFWPVYRFRALEDVRYKLAVQVSFAVSQA
jgi:hypothetical protein